MARPLDGGPPTARPDALERRLVHKMDFFILSFCCLSYFVNYLDRSNLANAYVSGMRDELGFGGDQLNQVNTCFTVGYIVGQIPSNLALDRVRPGVWFPLMMLLWGSLTAVTAAASSPQAVMAIRLVQGLCEASTFVGTHYVLGAWYTRRELGRRSGFFTASGLAGTMVGGFVQTAIHGALDGRRGLSGWRWLFLVDGLLTLPVALYGFVLFPDTPRSTAARYLSPPERARAVARVPEPERRPPLDRAFAAIVLTSRFWWGFVGLWVLAGEVESFGSNALLTLYMQAHPATAYTLAQLNNYPTGVAAAGIVSTLAWAWLTDRLGGRRQLVAYFAAVTGIATAAMVLAASRAPASPASTAVVFAAYYWAGAVYACQASLFAWCNDAMRSEPAAFRAVVLAGMNVGSNAVNAWWSILFYGASTAPWFTRGMWAMNACSVALALWTAGLSHVLRRADDKGPAEEDEEPTAGRARLCETDKSPAQG